METTMRLLIISAFVLLGGVAMATELKVPKKSMPARPDAQAACLASVAAECEAKNWSKYGKRACLSVKKRPCPRNPGRLAVCRGVSLPPAAASETLLPAAPELTNP